MTTKRQTEKGKVTRYLGRIAADVRSIDRKLDDVLEELHELNRVDRNGVDPGYDLDELHGNGYGL